MISGFASVIGSISGLTLDYQTDLLNYLVQESLAHAALIFATLAAAFTFATGIKEKIEWDPNETLVYFGIVFTLFSVAIYALFRFSVYASLIGFVLSRPQSPADNSLNSLWRSIVSQVSTDKPYLTAFSGFINFGAIGFVITISLAYLSAFLVTLFFSGKLPQVSLRNLQYVGVFVTGYSLLFIAAVGLIANPWSSFLSCIPTLVILCACWDYGRLIEAQYHMKPKNRGNITAITVALAILSMAFECMRTLVIANPNFSEPVKALNDFGVFGWSILSFCLVGCGILALKVLYDATNPELFAKH